MAWIELHQSLPTHRKTLAVADFLNIEPSEVVGHMACLWLWAIDNVPNGDLGRTAVRTIARAAHWKRKPEVFVEALVSAEFLDEYTDGQPAVTHLVIHDWDDYSGKLLDQRELRRVSNREAQSRRRQRLRQDDVSVPVSADFDDNQQSTVPNRTVPNQTLPTGHNPSAPNGASPHAEKSRGNPRVSQVIDAFRDLEVEVSMTARDHAAIKNSDAPPGLIAEVYDAVRCHRYGDDFMRKRLSVHEAVDWVNGYRESKAEPSEVDGECSCDERLEYLAVNKNSNPYCDVHGDVRDLQGAATA